MSTRSRRRAVVRAALLAAGIGLLASGVVAPAAAGPAPAREPVAAPAVTGPLPGTAPGDPTSPDLADTYPFFSTPDDLRSRGYVEQEFLLSGRADGYDTAGLRVATDVPYTTRVVVRRPADARRFNGTALVEWQNVTAGYDLDALWNADTVTRGGYAWVGVSAQRVGVDQLRGWSPARYGSLDVTGGGAYLTDQLSYDVFAQAGRAVATHGRGGVLGGLRARSVLALGASQSAGRLTAYYDRVLPQVEPAFDGYGLIVGPAPTRVGEEPVFQVLSETDVRSPVRPADTGQFRRWEVAGGAHSGWEGQQYRRPISERDLGAAPEYRCDRPPFSRVPVSQVTGASYAHLRRWVERGTPPPTAPPLEFEADGVTKRRDALGLALGGIRLSQVAVPTALNTGDNGGETFCRLFGSHVPFDAAQLAALYPSRAGFVGRVVAVDAGNVAAGFILPGDAVDNLREALRSGVGAAPGRGQVSGPSGARRSSSR